MMVKLLAFSAVPRIERIHPLEGGLFRRKYRRDRRPEMPLESRLVFYSRYAREIVSKHVRFATMHWQYRRILDRAMRAGVDETDVAMMPVKDEEFDTLEMYTTTPAAKFAVEKLRRYKGVQPVSGD